MLRTNLQRWWIRPAVCALLAGACVAAAAAPATPASKPSRRRIVSNTVVLAKPTNLIPGLAAQKQAQARIREIYALDYANTTFDGRRALARRMIAASVQTTRDTDAKFVLLTEARDVAALGGDVTTAFDAIDELVNAFPVTRLQQRIDVMGKAIPALTTPTANLAAVSICMDLVDQCVIEGNYDQAQVLLELASDATRAAKSVPHARWIETRSASIRPLKEAYDVARPAEVALSRAPGDKPANLVMGRFVAFVKGDFDAGLLMLTKGADPALAKLADQDLDNPDAPPEQFKLAAAWWEQGGREPDDIRLSMRQRAGFWYRKALPGLDGLDRALAERRLLELNPPRKPGDRPAFERPPDALKLNNHWYRASVADVTWETAMRLCEQAGGQLVCIETRNEGELIAKLARGRTLWIGGRLNAELRWGWVNDAPFFYSSWASGEPAHLTPDAHPCTTSDGNWKTSTGRAGFICEWRD